MKKLISATVIFIMSVLLFSNDLMAQNERQIQVVMQRQPNTYHRVDGDKEGHRQAPRPIICTIGESSGIQCDISDQIISYELWDIDANACFASYDNEDDFLTHLFSYPQSCQIRFITEEYSFFGNISGCYSR